MGTVRGAGSNDRLWVIALVFLLVSVAVWRWVASGAPTGGDGAQYLGHALALLEGRPYDDIGYLHTPAMWSVGPARYPPGLPVMLAPLLAVFGPFSSAPLVLMHLSLAAWVVLAGVYVAREEGRAMGVGVGGLVATSILLGDYANVVGSDLGFCALVWGVLVLADDPRWSWKRCGSVASLGLGALAYRLAAAPLVAAAGVLAVLQRRRLGWGGLAIVLAWAAMFYMIQRNFGLGEAATTAGAGLPLGAGSGSASGLAAWTQALDERFAAYQNGVSQALLYPFPMGMLNRAYHVVALTVAFIGIVPWLRRKATSFGALFAAGTGAMLLIAPVWQPRYLWVLFPFLGFGLLRGIAATVTAVRSRIAKRPPAPQPGLALRFSFVLVCLAVVTAMIRPQAAHEPELETWRQVGATLAELDADDSRRVASNRPRKVAWFTGVPAMPVVWRDLDRFLAEAEARAIRRIVYTTAVNERAPRDAWESWLSEYPDLFRLRAEVGPVRIYDLTRYSR